MGYKQLPPGAGFKKGKSGNPGGAPAGKRISTWMLELGQSPNVLTPEQVDKLPYNGKVAWARLKRAAKLDAGSEGERSAEILLDRTEGSVAQTLRTPDLKGPQTPAEILKFDAKWSILRRNLGLDKQDNPPSK